MISLKFSVVSLWLGHLFSMIMRSSVVPIPSTSLPWLVCRLWGCFINFRCKACNHLHTGQKFWVKMGGGNDFPDFWNNTILQKYVGQGLTASLTGSMWTGNPKWRGRLSTLDLLVLTTLDEVLLILQTLFTFFTKQATLMRRCTVVSLLL